MSNENTEANRNAPLAPKLSEQKNLKRRNWAILIGLVLLMVLIYAVTIVRMGAS